MAAEDTDQVRRRSRRVAGASHNQVQPDGGARQRDRIWLTALTSLLRAKNNGVHGVRIRCQVLDKIRGCHLYFAYRKEVGGADGLPPPTAPNSAKYQISLRAILNKAGLRMDSQPIRITAAMVSLSWTT